MDSVELELSVTMLCILLNVSFINFCFTIFAKGKFLVSLKVDSSFHCNLYHVYFVWGEEKQFYTANKKFCWRTMQNLYYFYNAFIPILLRPLFAFHYPVVFYLFYH